MSMIYFIKLVELKDYDIDIPKIVFHNIAETIDVSVKIKLEPVK